MSLPDLEKESVAYKNDWNLGAGRIAAELRGDASKDSEKAKSLPHGRRKLKKSFDLLPYVRH